MYWGLVILILLIGTAAVFIIQYEFAEIREHKKQSAEAEELENRIKQRKISENNLPLSDPIEHQDVQVSEVPNKNSQQNDSVETVPVEDYLEGLTAVGVTIPNDLFTDGADMDISDPNFTQWLQKYSKSIDAMMAAGKLSDETGGATGKEFVENVKNLTAEEKKVLAERIINRNKVFQDAVDEYINISREMPTQ